LIIIFGASGNTNNTATTAAENKSSYRSWNDLDNEVIAVGGFRFIRPEDGAMDKRNGYENILYVAETGSDTDENYEKIPLSNNGQNWTKGRMII
jgi:hypothetical protein